MKNNNKKTTRHIVQGVRVFDTIRRRCPVFICTDEIQRRCENPEKIRT